MKSWRRSLDLLAVVCLFQVNKTEADCAQLRGATHVSRSTNGERRRQLMRDRTEAPTFSPSASAPVPLTPAPTSTPSYPPSFSPSRTPTLVPSSTPTAAPTGTPSTNSPTTEPSFNPTMFPTVTPMPTSTPTTSMPSPPPSAAPSASPTGRIDVDLQNFQLILSGSVDDVSALTTTTEAFLLMEMRTDLPTLSAVDLQVANGNRKLQDSTLTSITYAGHAGFATEPVPDEATVQQSQESALQNQEGLQSFLDLNPDIGSNVVVEDVVVDGGGDGGSGSNAGLIAGVTIGGAAALALLGFVGFRYFKGSSPPPPPSRPPPPLPRTSEYQGYETESGIVEISGADSITVGASNTKTKKEEELKGTMDHRPEEVEFTYGGDDGKVQVISGDASVADESIDAYSLVGESEFDHEPEDGEKVELLQKLALYQGRQSRSPEINRATRYARKPSVERSPGEESTFSYAEVGAGGTTLLGGAESDEDDDAAVVVLDDALFLSYDDTNSPGDKVQAAQFQPGRNDSLGDVPFDEREGPTGPPDEVTSKLKLREEARELSRKINATPSTDDGEVAPSSTPPKKPSANLVEDDQQGLSSYLRERKRAARESRNNKS